MAIQKMQVVVQKTTFRAGCPCWRLAISKTLADRPSSKNCWLNRDIECPSVGTIFAHSITERSAMALRYTIAAKKAPNPTDRHVGSRVRMRRKMLAMSQEQLADALGITYQQVQKNEKGANRIGASRLQQISHILQVPVAFFFEGAPNASAPHGSNGSALPMAQIDDFVSDSNGLRLIEAFMRIDNAALRRRIVMLVQEIAGDDGH
jgi:transcriptional regulator with XRE-family HTH domain